MRRKTLRSLGALAVSGVLADSGKAAQAHAAIPQERTAPGTSPPRVLALIGDRYHNADYIRVALGRLFSELNLPIEFTINYAELSAARLHDYRLLVTFRDGYIWPGGYLGIDMYPYVAYLENREDWPAEKSEGWITEEQGAAIKQFVEAGNSLYAYHNSGYISLYSKNYREVMGAVTLGHPPLRPFKVKVVNPQHPITQGVSDFMVTDEQHYLDYDKDPQHIILRSENLDGLTYKEYGTSAVSGWAYDYGKGRVAFTAVGHTIHALWQPEYFKIQKNAVRWLLRML
jgi:hypothetical protein